MRRRHSANGFVVYVGNRQADDERTVEPDKAMHTTPYQVTLGRDSGFHRTPLRKKRG